MSKLDELLIEWSMNESKASDQAEKLGLKHMGFNRWGRGKEVTHKIANGMLKSVKAMERDVEQSDREYAQQKKNRSSESKKFSYKDVEEMVPSHWRPQLSDYFEDEEPDIVDSKFKNGRLKLKTSDGSSTQIYMDDHELQIEDDSSDEQVDVLKKIAKTGMTNKWEVVKDLYDELDLYYPESSDEFDIEDNKRIAKEALEHLEG